MSTILQKRQKILRNRKGCSADGVQQTNALSEKDFLIFTSYNLCDRMILIKVNIKLPN